MAILNDLFDSAELTGIARAELDNIEQTGSYASLAAWLPNDYIPSHVASYGVRDKTLDNAAKYRAFDAAPEPGEEPGTQEKTVRLPAVSETRSVSEETKLNLRSFSDEAVREHIQRTLREAVVSIYRRVNKQRATVLETGRATVDQKNFKLNDDFGRDPDLTTTNPQPWSSASASRLDYLLSLQELYSQKSGEDPGAIVMNRRVLTQLIRGEEFGVSLANGSTRRATADEVYAFLEGAGLPPIYLVNTRVNGAPLISDDSLLMLPAPVGTDQPEATDLGSTVWGITATALAEGFNIEDSELPGIVAGIEAPNRVPYVHEVFADSVNLPVLRTPNLSLAAKVL